MEKGFGNPRSITEVACEPDLSYHITSAGFLLPSLPPDEAPGALYNFGGHYFILYYVSLQRGSANILGRYLRLCGSCEL